MFYMRGENDDHLILGEEPVYTICPKCGIEHEIGEFWELLFDSEADIDLYGLNICCTECSKRIMQQREEQAAKPNLQGMSKDDDDPWPVM